LSFPNDSWVEPDHTSLLSEEEEAFVFPLSFAQQRLWFLDQLAPHNAFYNISTAVRLRGPLNIVALEQSLDEIVWRHEILQTTFMTLEGKPVQVIAIAPSLTVAMPVMDLQGLAKARQEAETERLATEEAQCPFDLTRGPLLRVKLVRLEERQYILLITMHHIISDGWSLGVFVRELAGLYEAFASGRSPLLPELPIQYVDFVIWQREWLQGDALEDQLRYWKRQLAPLSVLDLPADRPRPPAQTFRGAIHSCELPHSLATALEELSREEDVTLFMTLLAAFQTLLYRYTGQPDVVVGSPIANRNRPELENLIGFLANTLVLRADLAGDPSFYELLQQERRVCLAAYAHQDVPFEKLVEELQPERDLSRNPLFQVMFVLQSAPMPALELPGLTLELMETNSGTARFDLTLSVTSTAQGLEASFEYNTDLFDPARIRRMATHFQTLLKGIVVNLDQRLSDLPLLTETERQQLLVEWNDTQAVYPQSLCVHELFEAQVERTPDTVAAVFEDSCLTYQELNWRANRLAHHLRGLGVGPEVLVGICAERSLEMMIGLYGILKAGGAYVPLDPAYPQERLAMMLEDSRAAVLLTQQRLVERIPEHEARATHQVEGWSQGARDRLCRRVVRLDTDWETIAQQSQENPIGGATAGSLAYMIYTSGSMGRPKGVQVLQRAVVNFLESMRQQPGLTEQDVLLSVTTLSFDIAVLELFLPLAVGSCVVLVGRAVAVDGIQLAQVLAASGATVMQATPTTWRLLLESGWQGDDGVRILCGGEAFPSVLADELVGQSAALWNMYGPTETTVWSSIYEVRTAGVPITIGRPIANTEMYILDAHLAPVPIGVPGELYIGGDGLARGYFDRPELTAQVFIPNPFPPPVPPNGDTTTHKSDFDSLTTTYSGSVWHQATDYRPENLKKPLVGNSIPIGGEEGGGTRLYKTGDLVRYLPDGNVEFLGRADHQVKVRGFRIELGEIETVLAQHPEILETVVVVRGDEPGDPSIEGTDRRLVAYYVPDREHSTLLSELRDLIRQKLPAYMMPSAFVALEEMPLTLNGKVDRRALPAPDGVRSELAGVFVAPRTPTEEMLAGIWSQVLGIEQVGVTDDFFELGGHSLLVMQVVSRIWETWRVELPVHSFFETPTVANLARIVACNKSENKLQEIEELDKILKETEGLSEDEVEAALLSRGINILHLSSEVDGLSSPL
jgi:amino acid adenylation domain-containing protein